MMASHRAAASSRIDGDGSSTPRVAAAGRAALPLSTIAIIPSFQRHPVIKITVEASEIVNGPRRPLVWNKRPWYSNEQAASGSGAGPARRRDERVVNWRWSSGQRSGRGPVGKGGGG